MDKTTENILIKELNYNKVELPFLKGSELPQFQYEKNEIVVVESIRGFEVAICNEKGQKKGCIEFNSSKKLIDYLRGI